MSNKDSRSGAKFSGNHTTLIPAAAIIADLAHACPYSTNISPGFIKAGLPSVNGNRRVKIIDIEDGNILLAIRDNTSHQEITIYTRNAHETKLRIAKGARDNHLAISFGSRIDG